MDFENSIEQIKYPEIANELIEMAKADQRERSKAEIVPCKLEDSVDYKNVQKLKEIISKIAWPTVSKVGKEASDAAWLIAQHADHDCDFQKEALSLMDTEAKEDINLQNLAFLSDRLSKKEKGTQLYGTQFAPDENGKFVLPIEIEDPENLDKRRAEMGLGPWEEYYQEHLKIIEGKEDN